MGVSGRVGQLSQRCRNVSDLRPSSYTSLKPCRLHCEVEAFVKYMSPTPVEDEIRGLVIQLVSNAIMSAFPDARILPFGSYETKLYLPSGCVLNLVKPGRVA